MKQKTELCAITKSECRTFAFQLCWRDSEL